MMSIRHSTSLTYLVTALLAVLWFSTTPGPLAAAGEVTVEAQVASREVYVGQPFTLQLEITGADDVAQPPLSLDTFRVEPQGGTNRSQTYQISINGKVETTTTLNYIYHYQLTPLAAGHQTIPAIRVEVAGTSHQTTPITMTVKEPEESDDFKLLFKLSKNRCYKGEPLTLTTTWLIGRDLKGADFNLPIFSDPRFELYPRQPAKGGNGEELVEIELAGHKVIGTQTKVRQNGRDFITITFVHTLIPRATGRLHLPDGTLAMTAFDGYRQARRRAFGRDPFDMFGSTRRKKYRTVVIPAVGPDLEVRELPKQGRPPHFSGLVGQYTMVSEASPTTVNVGDPIALTVSVGGSFVDNLSLPPLADALPQNDFKTAGDTPQSSLTGGIKSFTSTIRARHHQVSQIPALSLPYFNPETGSYEVARSKPIALDVQATRVITADDALGATEPAADPAPATTGLEAGARQDIRPIYEELASSAPARHPTLLSLAILILPPLLFGLTLFVDYYRHDDSREFKHRRRLAYRHLRRRLRTCNQDDYFEVWLEFLGDKLGRPAKAVTLGDVLAVIKGRSTDGDLAHEVKEIFDKGEAALYGGLGHVLEKQELLRVAKKLAKVL